MAIRASFDYEGVPELSPRVLQKMVRESLEEALKFWRESIEPKHFTRKAMDDYAYKPRSKGYQIKKAKKKGTTAMLVYSGQSKAQALGSNRITSRGNQVTLSISVPDYWQHIKSNEPDMQKELTTVTPAEKELIAKKMDEFIQRRINQRLSKS